MSALSIVVPVDSEDRGFKAFLVHLLQAVAPLNGSEIIVVDGTAGAGVSLVCRSNGICVIRAAGGRLLQMNRGAALAHGGYVLFLDPNVKLPENFADIWRSIRRAGPVWGFFSLRVNQAPWRLRWLARVISLRSRISGIAVEDQPLFVQRNAWKLAGDVGEGRLDSFFELCRRLRVLTSPWVAQQAVDSQSARWQRASWPSILCAGLSSRLYFGGDVPHRASVNLVNEKTGAGRKRAPELP